MFWKKARKKYANLSEDDKDIRKFYELSAGFQDDLYRGLTGYLQDLGHKFVFSHINKGNILEVGFGAGRSHLHFRGDLDTYYPIDTNIHAIKEEVLSKYKNAIIADVRNIPFPDDSFDNVVSIYNLEHIKEIGVVIKEVQRVLKANGKFLVALPCEDGFAWNLGRELISRPHFMKKYNINYDKLIACEHVHSLRELCKILKSHFGLESERYYPFLLPIIDINLIYCAVLINIK